MISCNTKLSHEDAVKYYFSILNLVNKANNETSLYFIDEMNIMGSSEINDTTLILNNHKIDSLNKRFKKFISYLDSNIEALNNVPETDKSINLKLNGIAYLKQNKDFCIQMSKWDLDTVAEHDENRIEDQTASRNLIHEVMKNDLNNYWDIFLKSSDEYIKKHLITNEELKKNNLYPSTPFFSATSSKGTLRKYEL